MANTDYYLVSPPGEASILSDGAGKYAAKANRWGSSLAATDFSPTPPHKFAGKRALDDFLSELAKEERRTC